MPEQQILKTSEALGAVWELLDRPDEKALPASSMCANYWLQLDKVLLVIGLSDRTFFLGRAEFNGSKDALEVSLGETEFFGSELGLEIYSNAIGRETRIPVPLIGDMRDLAMRVDLAASVWRDPAQPSIPMLRFSQPLADDCRFRLWFEPGSFNRPGINDRPVIPGEAMSYLICLTGESCLSSISDAYSAIHYEAVEKKVLKQVADFGAIFERWVTKDTASTPQRKAFNESRRGQGRYGGGSRVGRRGGPIISGT